MGNAYIKGSIIGKSAMRECHFWVVEEGHHIGLPKIDIDALDLQPSMFASDEPTSDDRRPIISKRYQAGVNFADCYIDLDVVPAEEPSIGANALRTLVPFPGRFVRI